MTTLLTDVDIFIYQKYFVVRLNIFECVTNCCLIGDGLNVVVSPHGLILDPESTKLSSVTDTTVRGTFYVSDSSPHQPVNMTITHLWMRKGR